MRNNNETQPVAPSTPQSPSETTLSMPPTTATTSANGSELIPVREQETYRYDRLAVVLNILLFSIAVTAGLAFYNILIYPTIFQASTVYFPMTTSGQLIQEPDLDKPNLPNNSLLNWVAEILMRSMTLNFVNYNIIIADTRIHFTTEGFEYYKTAIKDAKLIDKILKDKLVIQAIAFDAPQITKEGVLAGRYLWKIKMPMEFRYRNVTTATSENYDITLLVMRVPASQSPMGVAILKYELEKKSLIPATGGAPRI